MRPRKTKANGNEQLSLDRLDITKLPGYVPPDHAADRAFREETIKKLAEVSTGQEALAGRMDEMQEQTAERIASMQELLTQRIDANREATLTEIRNFAQDFGGQKARVDKLDRWYNRAYGAYAVIVFLITTLATLLARWHAK